MTRYDVVNKFLGYRNKTDRTNLPPGVLVVGSQNVLMNDGERVAVRKGYTLDGQSSTALTPILSSFDWETHFGANRNLRSFYDKLQYRYVDTLNVVTWRDLMTGLGDAVNFNYVDFWDTTEQSDVLLFVNGSSNIYEWSGGITTYASSSNTAINLRGNNALLTSTGVVTVSPRFTIYRNNLVGTSFQASVVFSSQPNNGDVLILNYNGGGAQVQFVSTIGATPGNVLIGATLTDTITNLIGLLTTPGTTNATQVAFSSPNQTAVGYTTSSATDTITKQGTTTWAEDGFFTTGTRKVTINGVEYAYTGGEATTTLTGVSPDPSGAGILPGDIIVQTVRVHPNSSSSGLPATFKNDLIAILNNQIYIGSLTSREVYVSRVDSFTNFTFSSPRRVGEGALLTLDASAVGFIAQEESMYITAGKDMWFQTDFKTALSSAEAVETLSVLRLKTNNETAAQSQALIAKIKNYVFFIDNEPTLSTLGKLELIDSPQTVNISDPIKLDFDIYDFTGGQCYYWKNYIFIAIPADGVVRMFNLATGFWEAPQLLSISRFSTINGDLYGHSSLVPETYKMFTGFSDRATDDSKGNPIDARAYFSYQNFGDRANQKNFLAFFNEGYISSNTSLLLTVLFNYQGCEGSVSAIISGSDPRTVCTPPDEDGSLGKQSLGKRSLAGRGATVDETLPPKYRVIKTFPKTDFFECQVVYSSNDIDQRWELLAWGPAVQMSTSTNAAISE